MVIIIFSNSHRVFFCTLSKCILGTIAIETQQSTTESSQTALQHSISISIRMTIGTKWALSPIHSRITLHCLWYAILQLALYWTYYNIDIFLFQKSNGNGQHTAVARTGRLSFYLLLCLEEQCWNIVFFLLLLLHWWRDVPISFNPFSQKWSWNGGESFKVKFLGSHNSCVFARMLPHHVQLILIPFSW